jgi:hypothetical protein
LRTLQALTMGFDQKQPLAYRIRIELCHIEWLRQGFVFGQPAAHQILDGPDPVLDDLGLSSEIVLAARLAVAGHDGSLRRLGPMAACRLANHGRATTSTVSPTVIHRFEPWRRASSLRKVFVKLGVTDQSDLDRRVTDALRDYLAQQRSASATPTTRRARRRKIRDRTSIDPRD